MAQLGQFIARTPKRCELKAIRFIAEISCCRQYRNGLSLLELHEGPSNTSFAGVGMLLRELQVDRVADSQCQLGES